MKQETPQVEEEEEELLIQKEYFTNYNSDLIKIIIGKTTNNIIIRNTYYELKISAEDLSLLTKISFESIDDAFKFFENLLNKNKYRIKEKTSKRIKLIITTSGVNKEKEKDIELLLEQNFENKNFLIKDLYDKYINLEKEINEVKNDNKILKEENNILKQNNDNLKFDIENIKGDKNEGIKGLEMQYLNMLNTMNYIQQQINQFMIRINEIEQIINSTRNDKYKIANQNHSLNSSLNNLNKNINEAYDFKNNINKNQNNNILIQKDPNINNIMNDTFNLNDNLININSNEKRKINILFKGSIKFPINIQCQEDDLISTLIKKFRKEANFFTKYCMFEYNAKYLKENLTVKEVGLSNNGYILVRTLNSSTSIKFKISGIKDDSLSFRITENYLNKVSKLIEDFLSLSGLISSKIIKYEYNNKILNGNITLEEAGLNDNSEIIVYAQDKIKSFYLNFKKIKSNNNNNKTAKIGCLNTEKMYSIIARYLYETKINISMYDIKFLFNSKEINKEENIEKLGLTNGSTIIADFNNAD